MTLAGAVGLCLVAVAAFAGEGAGRAEGSSVPLYTNADLDRLAPLPQQTERIAPAAPAEDWDMVLRLIQLDHERLESERQAQLERERLMAFRENLDAVEDYSYGRYGWAPGAFFVPGSFGHRGSFTPTPRDMLFNRLRVPAGQRGIHSAQDAFEESRHEFALQRNQPPIGLRP